MADLSKEPRLPQKTDQAIMEQVPPPLQLGADVGQYVKTIDSETIAQTTLPPEIHPSGPTNEHHVTPEGSVHVPGLPVIDTPLTQNERARLQEKNEWLVIRWGLDGERKLHKQKKEANV